MKIVKNPSVDLPIRNKLPGLPRKAESIKWFAQQRTYPLGYIPQDAEIKAVECVRQQMMSALAARGYNLKQSAAGQFKTK